MYNRKIVPDLQKRRQFLQRSTACAVLLAVPHAVTAATVLQAMGEVLVNGARAMADTVIKAGDTVRTGAGASLTFVLGADAFMLRQMSTVQLESKAGSLVISGLRVVTGAVLAVFGPGMRSVMTGLVTAAIRGTGIYVEAGADQTYFCTCYGDVGLTAADGSRRDVVTRNHSAHVIRAGGAMQAAPLMNHSNAELAALEKLVGRVPRLAAS